MQTCSTCKQVKSLNDFYKCGTTARGNIRISHECKECRKAREMQRYYDKTDVVDGFKKPCVHCGNNKLYLIEFHHRNPEEKEFVIAHWRKKSDDALMEELKKCDCLCKNCHEEFHYLNRTLGLSYPDYINNNF
jgi:hypothetical protein